MIGSRGGYNRFRAAHKPRYFSVRYGNVVSVKCVCNFALSCFGGKNRIDVNSSALVYGDIRYRKRTAVNGFFGNLYFKHYLVIIGLCRNQSFGIRDKTFYLTVFNGNIVSLKRIGNVALTCFNRKYRIDILFFADAYGNIGNCKRTFVFVSIVACRKNGEAQKTNAKNKQ